MSVVFKAHCLCSLHLQQPQQRHTAKNTTFLLPTLQEEMMKVTLLIAVCTLLLLQQMQTPMAQPTVGPPQLSFCESILLFNSMRTDQQTLM